MHRVERLLDVEERDVETPRSSLGSLDDILENLRVLSEAVALSEGFLPEASGAEAVESSAQDLMEEPDQDRGDSDGSVLGRI